MADTIEDAGPAVGDVVPVGILRAAPFHYLSCDSMVVTHIPSSGRPSVEIHVLEGQSVLHSHQMEITETTNGGLATGKSLAVLASAQQVQIATLRTSVETAADLVVALLSHMKAQSLTDLDALKVRIDEVLRD